MSCFYTCLSVILSTGEGCIPTSITCLMTYSPGQPHPLEALIPWTLLFWTPAPSDTYTLHPPGHPHTPGHHPQTPSPPTLDTYTPWTLTPPYNHTSLETYTPGHIHLLDTPRPQISTHTHTDTHTGRLHALDTTPRHLQTLDTYTVLTMNLR